MPTKSTIRLPRGLDRRVRRSRTHSAAARAPRTHCRLPPHHGATAQQRIEAALAALAPNTRRAYVSAWSAWQRWAATSGCQAIPDSAADVAGYLEARHAGGAVPATIRGARAAIAKVHQVSGLADPTADSLCRDVLHRIGREGRRRGRSQVAGIGWAQAEAAAALAGAGSGGLQGLRDAAIILVLSDTLARISEVAALQCRDVEAYPTHDGGGSVNISASKADQFGEGVTRYSGRRSPRSIATCRQPATLSDRCSAGCCAAATAVARRSPPTASGRSFASGLRPCPTAAGASAVTRSGSAVHVSWRQPAPAWRSCSRPAAGARLQPRRSTFAARPPPAVRSPATATRWAGSYRPRTALG